ncbi:MAG: NHL repeat-containing protein, partial [Planctomycetota bacterium]
MKTKSTRWFGIPGVLGVAALAALFLSPAVAAQGTEVEELVMYGIDSTTNRLLRYSFAMDEFTDMGVPATAGGEAVHDCESLAWVPSGPGRGMYTSQRGSGPLEGFLLRIDPLTTDVTVVSDLRPWKDINAMVVVRIGPDWMIFAHDYNDEEFVLIDPVDGSISFAFAIPGIEFEGLAQGPDGTIYANTDTALYTIDVSTGTETLIGSTSTSKMEALEYAFGDGAPQINIPGIPAAWTADGALIGFEDGGELMIIDPASGSTQEYNGTFTTIDCEGLVFLTQMTDPYGKIVFSPH